MQISLQPMRCSPSRQGVFKAKLRRISSTRSEQQGKRLCTSRKKPKPGCFEGDELLHGVGALKSAFARAEKEAGSGLLRAGISPHANIRLKAAGNLPKAVRSHCLAFQRDRDLSLRTAMLDVANV